MQLILDSLTNTDFVIGDDEVKIYHSSFSHHLKFINRFWDYLTPSEKRQVSKIKKDKARVEKIISLGLLKKLLGKFLDQEPTKIKLEYTEFRKPFVILNNFANIEFNISHSNNNLLIGLTIGSQIGVDIEYQQMIDNMNGVMNMCFTKHEIQKFNNSACNDKLQYFYDLWTVKEAFIKAIGKGFNFSPLKIEILLNENGNPIISKLFDNSYNQKDYQIISLPIISNYSASMVLNTIKNNINCMPFYIK